MKKAFLFLCIMLLAFVFVGCVENTTSVRTQVTTATTSQTTTTTTTTVVATDDSPVITGADNITIEKNAGFIPLSGVSAFDTEDGDLTSSISYSGNVNPNAVGVYTATYTVVDSDGHITVVSRTVTVILTDTQAPLLSGVGNKTIYVGTPFNPLTGVAGNDTIDGVVTVTSSGTVNIWVPGDYSVIYSATDLAGNVANATRIITVSFGDFEFGDQTTYATTDFSLADFVYTSPLFSGGIINDNIANFTYVKVVVSVTSDVSGTATVALGSASGSQSTIAVSTTETIVTLYYLITAPLTDATFTITATGLVLDFDVDVHFAEVRDMIAPVINIFNDEYSFPLLYDLTTLRAKLLKGVTAVDNLDGNLTSSIVLNLLALDTSVVGTYEVEFTVTDMGNNTTTIRRNVIIANLVDSGYLTDPTFQNQGDSQWRPKSDNGAASIGYTPLDNSMQVTVTSLGGWASAAGAYFSGTSNNFVVGQWYMFTFDIKCSMNRQMMLRMGLQTNQANGWLDDFDGNSSGNIINITSEYVTYNYFFKLDSLVSTDGSTEFKIELNLGNINYSNVGVGSITSFRNVYMYKLTTSFEAPTFTKNVGETLPTTFTVGSALPNFADYVSAKDMSNQNVVVTYNASTVDMNTPGDYVVTYSATDSHDLTSTTTITFTVTSVLNADTVAPVVTLNSGIPTTIDQFTNLSVDLTLLVTAVDAVDGNITILASMVTDGGLNFNVAGLYTVTYRVYDAAGNVGVLEVVVTILDKQAPTIVASDITVNFGDAFNALDGIVINDNVDGVIANSNLTVTGLDQFVVAGVAAVVGTFEITYTVTDAAGNTATKIIKVKVSSVIWDEDSSVALGTPNEGPTHSTATYDALEGATLITGIDTAVDPWDHARWVYYFDTNDLVFGQTYKFEITVKATTATDLYFWCGTTLSADPWIDSFDGAHKTVVSITNQYVTYSVIFTVDKESYLSSGSAKFQFMYGYLGSDSTNTIYVKSFNLVSEMLPTYTEVADLLGTNTEINTSTIAQDGITGVVTISDIQINNSARIVYYFANTALTIGETYRFKITIKADEARLVEFWIGSTLWEAPWLDTFDGGLQQLSITNQYRTYEVIFTVDKATYSANGAKFQFQYGFTGDLATNKIYISNFTLEHIEFPYVADQILIDKFVYETEDAFEVAWTHRTNSVNTSPSARMNLDVDNNALVFTLPAVPNGGWDLARKYASLLSFGATDEYKYLAFHMTNNTNVTQTSVWLYWSGSQNAFPITLPGIGRTGWAVIDVTVTGKTATQITDFAIGFNNWAASPITGSITIDQITLVKNPSELAFINTKVNVVVLDDFLYADEAAFEVAWTQRSGGTNYNPGPRMNLNPEYDSMTLTLADPAVGWDLARRYASLSSMGVTNLDRFLGFYVTNNTSVTTLKVWLYWTGSQNAFPVQLPAIGESGWAYIDISVSGHTPSEIIDFSFGFDSQLASPITGSLTVHMICAVENAKDFAKVVVDLPIVINYITLDAFTYADEAEFELAWTQRSSGINTSPSPRMNLDAVNDSMIYELPAVANNGWDLVRKYSSLSSFGVTDSYKYLYFLITNNTNVTSASVWLYWTGSQNSYSITLPAIGETGWVYIDITTSSKQPTQIIDFGLGFNNLTASQVTGSLTIFEIKVGDAIPA